MSLPQGKLVRLLPNGTAEDALDGRPLGAWTGARRAVLWSVSVIDCRRRWIGFQPWAPPEEDGSPQTILMKMQAPGP